MFDWPPGIQTKTKIKIAQILWTLREDFGGKIADSQDAVGDLIAAMRSHGVDIPEADVMGYRIILPHLDGGRYGHYVRRVVIGQRTKSIELVHDLPDESHLPDGTGGLTVDDQIDRQLFGGLFEPAQGPTRDDKETPERRGAFTPIPARGSARDDVGTKPRDERDTDIRDLDSGMPPAPVDVPPPEPARGDTRVSEPESTPVPARAETRETLVPARGETRDIASLSAVDDDDDLDDVIARLDREVAELSTPAVVDDGPTQPREIVDTIVSLMADLESMMATGVGKIAPEGRSETDWNALTETNTALAERLASMMRRAKAAETRIIEISAEKNRTIAGLEARNAALTQENTRLSGNIDALMRGERVEGQHLRTAQRFISERPSDRPEGGRNRGGRRDLPPSVTEGRNRNRTTGSESSVAYSVGPP